MDSENPWDPDQAWWLKLGHAETHHLDVVRLCAEFRARRPFEITEEGRQPGISEFVFRQHEPIPSEIGLVVGDVLHCLRSALDSLVFGLVLNEMKTLTSEQERACQFPIETTPQKFNDFIDRHKIRRAIYSAALRQGLRYVQPFFWHEVTVENFPHIEVKSGYEEEALGDRLWQIGHLSNIDKHRRLATTAVWPALSYFTHDEPTSGYRLTPVNQVPWVDGAVVARLTGTGPRPSQIVHECHIALVDISQWFESRTDLPELIGSMVARTRQSLQRVISTYYEGHGSSTTP